jgi:large subunit ribosomal protein L23
MDPYAVILRPDVTEKSMKLVETENKLVLVVSRSSNKNTIKEAVENLYDVKVAGVQTLITPKGAKKAYVKLTPDYKADEVATRIGIF